jgi:hypothetical protein
VVRTHIDICNLETASTGRAATEIQKVKNKLETKKTFQKSFFSYPQLFEKIIYLIKVLSDN